MVPCGSLRRVAAEWGTVFEFPNEEDGDADVQLTA